MFFWTVPDIGTTQGRLRVTAINGNFLSGSDQSVSDITITGISKGAGMIRPNMATMLGFLATDARVDQSVMHELALELAGNMFLPYVLFLPFAVFGLGWMIRKNFQPLHDFKTELASRKAQELKPIEMKDYPLELEPTIQEMNHLFGRISLAQQEQRQFVADSAHELRTPLTALNLQLQILLQQFPQSDSLHNLSQGVLRMQHLVNQLLSLAKQDASDSLTEPAQMLSLNQMTVACIEQLIQLALQKEIDLGLEQQQELLIHGQASALHSIIYNLIDNAIKYTPKGGVINVSIFQQGQQAILQIEDSGAGIDPAQFAQIRQRFYRIHNYAEIGSGLGLSIVSRIAYWFGGSVKVDQSPSLGGARFTMTWPAHRFSKSKKKYSVKDNTDSKS